MNTDEYLPGEPAPHTGEYHELNIFGTPTGWSIYANKGDALRPLPCGCKWRGPHSSDLCINNMD